MPRARPGSSGRSRSRKLTHSLSCPAQAGHPVFADNVHYGATVSVRSLSPLGERVGGGLQNYRETLTPHPPLTLREREQIEPLILKRSSCGGEVDHLPA